MKRFTGTEKWAKEWFHALKPKLKCLWLFICDNADPCGVWDPNFALASTLIGDRVAPADLAVFGDRVHKLASGKYLIVSFIEFQYGKLSAACPAHKPVFRAMDKNKVTPELLHSLCGMLQRSLQETEEEEETEEEGLGSAEGKGEPKPNRKRGTKEELSAYCVEIGQPAADGAVLFEKWEGNGWKNGTAPIVDWRATIRAWKGQGYLPSQKSAAGSGGRGSPQKTQKPAPDAEW